MDIDGSDYNVEYVSASDKEEPGAVQEPSPSRHSLEDEGQSVDENYDIASINSSIKDRHSCRGQLKLFLHGLPFQIVILALVFLDAIIVLFELLLDVGAFGNINCRGSFVEEQGRFCHYQLNSRPDCRPTPFLILNQTNVTEGNGTGFCQCGYRGGRTVCIPYGSDIGVFPGLILHYASLLILTFFMFELVVKIIAFRMKFFTHKFEVFDAIVVTISWILDVASSIREEAFLQFLALLILLRIWRVIRIINGAMLWTKTRSDNMIHQARGLTRNTIHALHKAQDNLAIEKIAYNQLKELLEQNGIEVPDKPVLKQLADYGNEQEESPEDKDKQHDERQPEDVELNVNGMSAAVGKDGEQEKEEVYL